MVIGVVVATILVFGFAFLVSGAFLLFVISSG